jgi:hypothetical protein
MAKDKDVKLAMMIAASKAIEYKKKKPYAETEEILRHVMRAVNAHGDAKIGAIAAATRAVKYKEQNPNAKDKEIMQRVMNESSEIVDLIGER